MAMVNVILEEGLHDTGYIREQTDLPFLVRKDNRRFLRGTDFGLTTEGADQVFYLWDNASGKPVPAPGTGFTLPPPFFRMSILPAMLP